MQHYNLSYSLFKFLFAAALILWGCDGNSDSTNNIPNDASDITDNVSSSSKETNSILCNEGETFTDGIITYICSDKKWIQQEITQQCTEGESFTGGSFIYTCFGGRWITQEELPQTNESSSSTTKPLENTNSSSSVKIKSSSSAKAKSSSSDKTISSSSEAACVTAGRNIYVQSSRDIVTATSAYKELKRTLKFDQCKNGKLEYPSSICDLEVPGQTVPFENRIINGISYYVWCYNGTLYFDLACSKEEEGTQDTAIYDGATFRIRKCMYVQGVYSWVQSGSDLSNLSIITDSRDGKNYRTIKIGNQTWMAENLNYEKPTKNLHIIYPEKSYCYNDSASYCAKYGRLYPWTETKYACPDGFHLPDSSEWTTLCATVGGDCQNAGKGLTAGTWTSTDPYWGTTTIAGSNTHGFAALLAGIKPESPQDSALYQAWGRYTGFSIYADFWTNTTAKDYVDNGIHYKRAYYFHIKSSSEGIYASISFGDQSESRSIRCIKD